MTAWPRRAVPQEVPLSTKPTLPNDKPVLLSEEVAASKCGVSRPTFRRWVAANCIKPVLVPGAERRKLYNLADIEVFVLSR